MGVRVKVVLPILKFRFWSALNCAGVRRSRPVFWSATAPVARWYLVRASNHG